MQAIPFQSTAWFEEQVTLEDVPYKFNFHWNTRGEFWSLQILDIEDVPLVSSIKIVNLNERIRVHPDRGLPPGALIAVDPNGDTSRIGFTDFIGERQMSLFYVQEDELDAFQ